LASVTSTVNTIQAVSRTVCVCTPMTFIFSFRKTSEISRSRPWRSSRLHRHIHRIDRRPLALGLAPGHVDDTLGIARHELAQLTDNRRGAR
jgi:hypothetical protein